MIYQQQTWQLQEAKNKFSQVVKNAEHHGPQVVTRRGVEVAVLISYEEFLRLREPELPTSNLADLLLNSPLRDLDLDLTRDPEAIPERITFE